MTRGPTSLLQVLLRKEQQVQAASLLGMMLARATRAPPCRQHNISSKPRYSLMVEFTHASIKIAQVDFRMRMPRRSPAQPSALLQARVQQRAMMQRSESTTNLMFHFTGNACNQKPSVAHLRKQQGSQGFAASATMWRGIPDCCSLWQKFVD